MTEGYSLEKYRWAKDEKLSPEDEAKLERFRYIRAEITKAVWPESRKARDTMFSILQELRQSFKPEFFRYRTPKGMAEHEALEEKYARSKEGQLELGQQEASFFNDAYDVRKNRLDMAIEKGKEENGHLTFEDPLDSAEYKMALWDFNQLVKDLKDSDLRKYVHMVRFRKDNEWWFGRSRSDNPMHTSDESEFKWEQSTKDEERALLTLLQRLPDGPKAIEIYKQIQGPNVSRDAFFNPMSQYYNDYTIKQPEGAGGNPHIITKRITQTRWLRITFYNNGYIRFSGRENLDDPGKDFREPDIY